MTEIVDDPIAEQRLDALTRANRVRTDRAKLKRELKQGRDPFPVLNRPPRCAQKMKVFEFLKSVPMIGRRKAERILIVTGVSPNRQLTKLTKRERQQITRAINEKGWIL